MAENKSKSSEEAKTTTESTSATSEEQTGRLYSYPRHSYSVRAKNRKEADKLLREHLNTKEKDNG